MFITDSVHIATLKHKEKNKSMGETTLLPLGQ